MGYSNVVRYLPLLLLLLACTEAGRSDDGGPCLTTSDCVDGTACVRLGGAEADAFCMTRCEADERLCENDRVCLDVGDETHVCLIGGEAEVGDECEDTTDCIDGSVCITEDAGSRCRAACDVRSPSDCSGSETCAPLTDDDDDGFCSAE